MSSDIHIIAFEKLKVWEEIRILIRMIYSLTKVYPKEEQFGIVNQIRRAVISVSSNLVEGSSRTSSKDQAHFYQLSYSSLMEVLSQVIVSKDLSYISESEYIETRTKIQSVSYLLNQLRKSTFSKPSQPIKP
jgi:four helix bundle protein